MASAREALGGGVLPARMALSAALFQSVTTSAWAREFRRQSENNATALTGVLMIASCANPCEETRQPVADRLESMCPAGPSSPLRSRERRGPDPRHGRGSHHLREAEERESDGPLLPASGGSHGDGHPSAGVSSSTSGQRPSNDTLRPF